MKSLRNRYRKVFFLVSFLVLLCMLIGSVIIMWMGISTQDQWLIVTSLIMILCAALGGMSLLQGLIPGLNILKHSLLATILWIMGVPICGFMSYLGITRLTTLLQVIFQGELLSLTSREAQDITLSIFFGFGLPLSIFFAWIKSRKLGRPIDEIWMELVFRKPR